MKKNELGFGAVGVVLVILLVAVLGFAGWRVWQDQNEESNTSQQSSDTPKEIRPVESTTKELSLADESVTFKTPTSWTKDGTGCIKNTAQYSSQTYLDSAALLPGEKLPTIYGNGTEYFHVNICVFENTKNLSPEEWYSDAGAGGIGMGVGSGNVKSSDEAINGNPAYYRKDMPDYETISYVVAAKDKIILITARTYDTSEDKPGVGDFRKFETAIKELAHSVQIKE